MNVPFTPFQQFEELNQHLLNPPYTEPNVRLYRNGTSDNLNLIVTERNQLLHLGHLSPTSPQLRHLNEEMASYMKARGRADKIYKLFQTHIIPQGGRLKGGMPIVYQPEEVRFVNELEQIEGLILFVEFENGTEGERRTKLRKAREMFDRLLPNVDNLHLTIMERMRFDMAQQQLNNLDAEYGMEYGYDEKKEGSGFSMNSERETNNGNLRIINAKMSGGSDEFNNLMPFGDLDTSKVISQMSLKEIKDLIKCLEPLRTQWKNYLKQYGNTTNKEYICEIEIEAYKDYLTLLIKQGKKLTTSQGGN
jgi:hypothetical protein